MLVVRDVRVINVKTELAPKKKNQENTRRSTTIHLVACVSSLRQTPPPTRNVSPSGPRSEKKPTGETAGLHTRKRMSDASRAIKTREKRHNEKKKGKGHTQHPLDARRNRAAMRAPGARPSPPRPGLAGGGRAAAPPAAARGGPPPRRRQPRRRPHRRRQARAERPPNGKGRPRPHRRGLPRQEGADHERRPRNVGRQWRRQGRKARAEGRREAPRAPKPAGREDAAGRAKRRPAAAAAAAAAGRTRCAAARRTVPLAEAGGARRFGREGEEGGQVAARPRPRVWAGGQGAERRRGRHGAGLLGDFEAHILGRGRRLDDIVGRQRVDGRRSVAARKIEGGHRRPRARVDAPAATEAVRQKV
ncbi:hypothetical protein BU14_2026s0001 [Porphyra umbilicalis]|uniref:Uncharacterized protein n=1 Tax=Porphyra umbilicalis TaxID=2786 RepID=A0A1X6NK17_PORUM|nr:hypothetical protein BU14_2026s0001 [Porphyra umbilicalis]|eukprot:OSX68969.1 hypothetical protein BU14_2026s0001 [Porphyra umbilicalis]